MKNTNLFNIVVRVSSIVENTIVVIFACIGIYEYIIPVQGILGVLLNVAASIILSIYLYLAIQVNIWAVDVRSPADAARVMVKFLNLIHYTKEE